MQIIRYEDVTVKVDMMNKHNEHGVEVIAINESFGAVAEIRDRVKRYIEFKNYPLALSETNDIQNIIMNVLHPQPAIKHPKHEGVMIKATDDKTFTISKKPPIGLKPRFIVVEERLKDIVSAMVRFSEANMLIPPEWIEEYNELVNWRNKDMDKKDS